MPRGGSRNGNIGTQYANRSDLAGPAKAATITAVPGQAYGAAGAQMAAQSAVPMANGNLNPAQGAGMGVGSVDPAAQSVSSGPAPGELGPLTGPSVRPNEPVTHGLNVGPGAGSEVFAKPNPLLTGLALLNASGMRLSPEIQAVQAALSASQANRNAP